MRKVNGKVVVLTGSSSGAGRAMAVALAREGAQLLLCARRPDALAEVVEECREYGVQPFSVTVDVKEMLPVYQLAKTAVEKYGGIDVWINNAGVLAAGAFDDIPAEVNEDVIRTNLLGYIHGAQAVLPIFKKQGRGVLINNISVGGWIATPYMAAYAASKFGLRGFFESLRGELLLYPDIRVCDLYPAFLDTPGIQHAANYTGKHIRPAPPVYDPARVAEAVVQLIQLPREKRVIGSASFLLKMAYSVFPRLSRNVTAKLIRTYLKKADTSAATSGNVLQPVGYGTSVLGGWEQYYQSATFRKGAIVAAALALAGSLLVFKQK